MRRTFLLFSKFIRNERRKKKLSVCNGNVNEYFNKLIWIFYAKEEGIDLKQNFLHNYA